MSTTKEAVNNPRRDYSLSVILNFIVNRRCRNKTKDGDSLASLADVGETNARVGG